MNKGGLWSVAAVARMERSEIRGPAFPHLAGPCITLRSMQATDGV